MFVINSRDDRAGLSLDPHNRDFFIATVQSRGLTATTQVSLYQSFGINEFFADLARDWRGWTDVRTWSSLEGELEIRATSDRSGHIYLEVALHDGAPARWAATVNLVVEAGQLTTIASDANRWETTVIIPAHARIGSSEAD